MTDPSFARDLYRGTADAYDRFRLRYPPAMTEDLLARIRPSGRERLLDLACGTGQLTFPLRRAFAEIWAVDQEPDMIRLVRAKAGDAPIRTIVAGAEVLHAEPDAFELIVVGNAFHRLRRALVAALMLAWLRPGGHAALCWSDSPWTGDLEWQRAVAEVLDRRRVPGRVPAGWDAARRAKPDVTVLAEAGFQPLGRYEFSAAHRWTATELAGYASATSDLAAVAGLDADVGRAIEPYQRDGCVGADVGFAYDLVGKPAG